MKDIVSSYMLGQDCVRLSQLLEAKERISAALQQQNFPLYGTPVLSILEDEIQATAKHIRNKLPSVQ